MALAGFLPRAAKGHSLIQGDVVADDRGLADDDAHAMIDEEAPADFRAGMDFDSGDEPAELRQRPRGKSPAVNPQPVMKAVAPQRMQTGVEHDDLQPGLRRGIAFQYRGDVFAYAGEHAHTVTSVAVRASDSLRSCSNRTLLK